MVLWMTKIGYKFGLLFRTARTSCVVPSLIALETMVEVVRVLHMDKGRIVQSPWCWPVPVALVVSNGAACVHLKDKMSNHSVGGLTKVQCGHVFAHGQNVQSVVLGCQATLVVKN